MTRNELTATFAAATTRKEVVTWLKAADAYSGHSRDGMPDLLTHMSAVGQAIAAELEAELKAEAKAAKAKAAELAPAPKAKAKKAKAPKAVMYNHPKKPVAAIAVNKARKARPGTIAKMAAVIAGATPDADGVIILTGMDYAMAGLGGTWPKLSNRVFSTPGTMQNDLFTSLGFTAVNTRGTTVLTPIASAQVAQVAS